MLLIEVIRVQTSGLDGPGYYRGLNNYQYYFGGSL